MKKTFFIWLIFFTSIFSNIIAQTNPGPMSIPKTLNVSSNYLNYPLNGQALYLQDFGLAYLDCNYTFLDYSLEIEVALNEISTKNISSNVSSYNPTCSFDITPTIFDVLGTNANIYYFNTYPNLAGGSNKVHVDLTKTNPKAYYHLDINSTTNEFSNVQNINNLLLTGTFALRFPITSFSSTQVDFNNLKITCTIKPKKVNSFHQGGSFMFTPSAQQNTTTKKVDFILDDCTKNSPLLYQIQILKLYNENESITNENNITLDPKNIDWKKALNIYTKNQTPSITLAEGTGYYVWRYRRVIPKQNSNESEPNNWTSWYENAQFANGNTNTNFNISAPTNNVFYFNQFDNEKNWIYSRNLIEGEADLDMKENLIGEGITYANGLGMVRQHQSFSNTNNEVVVSNEMQDFVGRSTLQTLSATVLGQNHLGYVQGFTGTYSVNDFDASDPNSLPMNYNNTAAMSNSILTDYYSNNNPDRDVPTADGFPFTRTLFGRNSQNEVKETSMPGATHSIKTADKHTIRSLVGSTTDDELIRIFGDEAPPHNTVLKKISTDANNETNITYVDKTGKTIATCLSVDPSALLQALASKTTAAFTTKQKINTNTQDNNSITASESIVFEKGGVPLTISYQLNEKSYQDVCASLCSTCDYKVTFTIVNQEDPNAVLWQGESIINPATLPCSSLTNTLHNIAIYTVGTTTPNNTYTIQDAGKYLVTKKVEFFNNKTSTVTFLDDNINQLETYLRGIYLDPTLTNKNWEVWDGITNAPILVSGSTLKINLLELRQKLEAKKMKTIGTDIGVYEMLKVDPTNEAVNKRILKFVDASKPTCATEIKFEIQACKQVDCSDVDAFVNKLFTDLHNTLNNPNTNVNNGALGHFTNGFDDIFRLNSTLLANGIGSGTGYSTISTSLVTGNKYIKLSEAGMKRIIKNMLTDPDVFTNQSPSNILMKYDCEEIARAFNFATTTLIEFYSPSATLFRTNNGLVMEPDFLDEFLQSAGYKFTGGTDVIGDPATANSKGFTTTPYRCFKYSSNVNNLFIWAKNSLSNTSLSGAGATVLYFNNYYNTNLPNGCTALLPTNDASNINSNVAANCFSPNVGYFASNTALTSGTCVPNEIPAPILVMAYKSLINGNNSSVTAGGAISLPDPTNQESIKQFALKMEDDCLKACNERYNEISSKVAEIFITPVSDGGYGFSTVEGYKNGAYSTLSQYGEFEISHRDVFVSGIIENCKSKCKVDVVPITVNGNTLYKLDDADMQEYTKALMWDVDLVKKELSYYQDNCTSCKDLVGGVLVPSTNCSSAFSNLNAIYATPNFNFQMFGNIYYTCCKDAFAKEDLNKYPLENADPRIPKQYAKVYIPNSDFIKSAYQTMLPFLNKSLTNKILLGHKKFNIYKDILNYQSPIQYPSGNSSSDYEELISKSNSGNQILTNGAAGQDIFDFTIPDDITNAHFSIGGEKKTIVKAGTNYIIERTTQDILPFHVTMPVKIKIYRSPTASSSLPEFVQFEELLKNYSLIDPSAPVLSFNSELSQLKFSKLFKNANDVFEFEFNVRVNHDYNNPANLTKSYKNADIDAAYNLSHISCFGSYNNNYGKPIVYSESLLKTGANALSLITLNITNNSPSTCLATPSNNIVFIPYLKNFSSNNNNTSSPTSMTDPLPAFQDDYSISYKFNQPAVNFTPDVPYKGNANVQVAPLYFNYTDLLGVKHHDFVMDLSAFKTFWHNYFCLQWHPYAPINDENLAVDVPISCVDAEALEVLDLVNGGINAIIDLKKNELKTKYQTNCVLYSSLQDDFTIAYPLGYHHYTLYYYDRAGNLVRTVPPEGVQILDGSTPSLEPNRTNHPNHRLVTEYNYNSLNAVSKQTTPDGGTTNFWYDNLGRIRFSQNAKQAPLSKYSFSNYDNLGRIVSVGQITTALSSITPQINNPIWPTSGTITDLVTTVYNNGYNFSISTPPYTSPASYCNSTQTQRNLLNRVSYTIADADGNPSTLNDRTITFYSYDIHGNVEWVGTKTDNMQTSYIRYEYDLISGSVVKVVVNECDIDAFQHKYVYDTDKRLQKVFTSRDGQLWDNDATYEYYKHGPLRNVTIGQDKVQKIDYGYTIMGWLKGINHLSKNNAATTKTGVTPFEVEDLYATKLHYFDGDFNRSYGGVTSAFNTNNGGIGSTAYNISGSMDGIYGGISNGGLYNGNIRGIYTAITNPTPGTDPNNVNQLFAHVYQYDELNRLLQTHHYGANATSSGNYQLQDNGNKYKEIFTYDANGNIKTLKRHDGTGVLFDDFAYDYPLTNNKLISNQLNRVDDAIQVSPSSMAGDYDIKKGQAGTNILDHLSNNYRYDKIGNLIEDKQEKLEITWNNFGKVAEVIKDKKMKIVYVYDATGNRVAKNKFTRVNISDPYPLYAQTQEYYVRDASGNIMTNYIRTNTSTLNGTTLTWQSTIHVGDQPIYGSERIGVYKNNAIIKSNYNYDNVNNYNPYYASQLSNYRQLCYRTLNLKRYELKDHLGNVRTNFSDILLAKNYVSNAGAPNYSTTFPYNGVEAHQTSLYNYYSFGMPKPNHGTSATNWLDETNNISRNGFNDKENDNDVMGIGNFQDYGLRMYNTRNGRFISEDPLTQKYPELTPYQFASNTPIVAVDLDGAEAMFIHGTGSDPSTWGKVFKKDMLHAMGWDKVQKNAFSWKWSGGNNKSARQNGANALVNWATSDKNPYREMKHMSLISHSHGGNVAKLAKNQLEKLGWTIDLINIETPQRTDYQTSYTFNNAVFLNFYSNVDLVQFAGSIFKATDIGSRRDINADKNILLVENTPSDYMNPSYNWTIDFLGHSLHNNKFCQLQIIAETQKAFKDAPPIEGENPMKEEEINDYKITISDNK